MADAISYIITALIIIIAVYFILTGVIYPTSSPSTTQSGNLNTSKALDFAHSPLVQVTKVSNATVTCTNDNFTITSTTIKLAGGAVCVAGAYTVAYDYQNDPIVMGINFGFIIVLFAIAMLVILIKAMKSK
jgi:hypothetical protein